MHEWSAARCHRDYRAPWQKHVKRRGAPIPIRITLCMSWAAHRHRLDVARARDAPRGYKRSGQRRFLLRCTLCMSSPLSGLYVCCSNVPTVGWLPNTEEILKDSISS